MTTLDQLKIREFFLLMQYLGIKIHSVVIYLYYIGSSRFRTFTEPFFLNFDGKIANILLMLLVDLFIDCISRDKPVDVGGLDLPESTDSTDGLRLCLLIFEVILCEEWRDENGMVGDR